MSDQEIPVITISALEAKAHRLGEILRTGRGQGLPINIRRQAWCEMRALLSLVRKEGSPPASVTFRRTGRGRLEGVFMRKTTANLLARLNDKLQDAAVRIGEAPALFDAKARYIAMNYGAQAGYGGGECTHEQYLRMLKRIRIYTEWHRRMVRCSPMSLSACERVCQREDSLDQIRKDERIDWDTALKLLQYGLNEYAILAGWGDQIGG